MKKSMSRNHKDSAGSPVKPFPSCRTSSGLTAPCCTILESISDGVFTIDLDKRITFFKRLSGFSYDVKHIATYAPYCDDFITDQPMAALVRDPGVGLEDRYGVKIFSLNNWDQIFAWVDALEADMTEEHKAGLAAAYP